MLIRAKTRACRGPKETGHGESLLIVNTRAAVNSNSSLKWQATSMESTQRVYWAGNAIHTTTRDLILRTDRTVSTDLQRRKTALNQIVAAPYCYILYYTLPHTGTLTLLSKATKIRCREAAQERTNQSAWRDPDRLTINLTFTFYTRDKSLRTHYLRSPCLRGNQGNPLSSQTPKACIVDALRDSTNMSFWTPLPSQMTSQRSRNSGRVRHRC